METTVLIEAILVALVSQLVLLLLALLLKRPCKWIWWKVMDLINPPKPLRVM